MFRAPADWTLTGLSLRGWSPGRAAAFRRASGLTPGSDHYFPDVSFGLQQRSAPVD
jgi:hypothetical protein